jgi:hypothetical protein
MSLGLLAFLALAPILAAAVLLVGLRWPARLAMPVVYLTAAVIALLAWQMPLLHILASTIQGLFITFRYPVYHLRRDPAAERPEVFRRAGVHPLSLYTPERRPAGAGGDNRLALRLIYRGSLRLWNPSRYRRATPGGAGLPGAGSSHHRADGAEHPGHLRSGRNPGDHRSDQRSGKPGADTEAGSSRA